MSAPKKPRRRLDPEVKANARRETLKRLLGSKGDMIASYRSKVLAYEAKIATLHQQCDPLIRELAQLTPMSPTALAAAAESKRIIDESGIFRGPMGSASAPVISGVQPVSTTLPVARDPADGGDGYDALGLEPPADGG